MWSVWLVIAAGAAPAGAEETPVSWASSVAWGAPLPRGVVPEDDWPWATEEGARCGWQGETLLCDDGDGVSRAYRAWEGAVVGTPGWIRCAGLEWCAGTAVSRSADGRSLTRWASRVPPHRGWEWAAPPPSARVDVEREPVPVTIVGGEDWGEHLVALAAQVGGCAGAETLDEFPAAVLYDDAGARKVRLQGVPPEAVDAMCLVEALSTPPRPADGGAVEVMLTGISAPR